MKTLLNTVLIMLFSFIVALAIDAKPMKALPKHPYTVRYYERLRRKAERSHVVKRHVVRRPTRGTSYVFQ